MAKQANSESAALKKMWGALLLESTEIDRLRESMGESTQNYLDAITDEEREYWPNEYWGARLKDDIAKAFIANDEVITNTCLVTLDEVQHEIEAREEWMDAVPRACFFSSYIQHYLLHALKALLKFQHPLQGQLEASALIDEACLRLSQASGLMRDLSASESAAYGSLGVRKVKGNILNAKKTAQRYVEQNLLRANGEVKSLKALTYEAWELLFSLRDQPDAFMIAGEPDAPTERALKTVRSYISNHYKLLINKRKTKDSSGVTS